MTHRRERRRRGRAQRRPAPPSLCSKYRLFSSMMALITSRGGGGVGRSGGDQRVRVPALCERSPACRPINGAEPAATAATSRGVSLWQNGSWSATSKGTSLWQNGSGSVRKGSVSLSLYIYIRRTRLRPAVRGIFPSFHRREPAGGRSQRPCLRRPAGPDLAWPFCLATSCCQCAALPLAVVPIETPAEVREEGSRTIIVGIGELCRRRPGLSAPLSAADTPPPAGCAGRARCRCVAQGARRCAPGARGVSAARAPSIGCEAPPGRHQWNRHQQKKQAKRGGRNAEDGVRADRLCMSLCSTGSHLAGGDQLSFCRTPLHH